MLKPIRIGWLVIWVWFLPIKSVTRRFNWMSRGHVRFFWRYPQDRPTMLISLWDLLGPLSDSQIRRDWDWAELVEETSLRRVLFTFLLLNLEYEWSSKVSARITSPVGVIQWKKLTRGTLGSLVERLKHFTPFSDFAFKGFLFFSNRSIGSKNGRVSSLPGLPDRSLKFS